MRVENDQDKIFKYPITFDSVLYVVNIHDISKVSDISSGSLYFVINYFSTNDQQIIQMSLNRENYLDKRKQLELVHSDLIKQTEQWLKIQNS